MTSIVLTVPLCLTNSLLSIASTLLRPTNTSPSTKDRASKKNMHLLISLILAIEIQTCRLFLFLNEL